MSIQIPDSDEWLEQVCVRAEKNAVKGLRRLEARQRNASLRPAAHLDESVPEIGAEQVDKHHDALG